MADALYGLASDDGTSGSNRKQRRAFAHAKVIVRVDAPAYERGHTVAGEICEIVGYGPVPVSVVKEMVDKGGAFAAAVLTAGREVLTVAHLGRKPTALQHTALEWIDPLCAAEGCNNIHRLEVDHRHDWAKTKRTTLDELDNLCRLHHRLKTCHGWALVAGRGKRAFVPPDDPRHPNNQPAPVTPVGEDGRPSAAAELVEAIRANARTQQDLHNQRTTTTNATPVTATAGREMPTTAVQASSTTEQLGLLEAANTRTRDNSDRPDGVNRQAAARHAAGNGQAVAPETVANGRTAARETSVRGKASARETAANDPPEP